MRLVLSRAAARTLLVAATVAATVTTVLVTTFVLYAQLLPVAAVRTVIVAAPAEERSLWISGGTGGSPDELAARDAAVRELFGDGLAGVPLTVSMGGYASGQELTTPVEGSAVVGFLPDLADHAELVAGRWPEPTTGDGPVPTVLPVDAAGLLEVTTGDQLTILDTRSGQQQPVPMEVVGLWQPVDPADPYWQILGSRLELGGIGPFVVHPDEFLTCYLQQATVKWVAAPDPTQMAAANPDALRTGVRALTQRLSEWGKASQQLPEWGKVDPGLASLRLYTDLDQLAERLGAAVVVNRSGILLSTALLVVVAGYGLVLVAQLLAAYRGVDNALLRARGASRWQLAGFAAGEALLVVAPAAVLGAPVGTWLVQLIDHWFADGRYAFVADLASYGWWGPPLAWLTAGVAALGCATALTVPAAGRGRTWTAELQERSRPSKAAARARRAGVDVALAAVALLAWGQLRRYGTALTPRDAGLGIVPLLVAAPVLGVLAGTALAMRLLPLATRAGVRLMTRRGSFAGLLGMWQADRRPHAGPVLLLVLAVATAVLAPTVASTWRQSQRDQADQWVGADLRAMVVSPTASSGTELAAAAPEAELMPVHRTTLTVSEAGRFPLLAIDSERAPEVVRLRSDLAPTGPDELFATLREGRPELRGLPLPEGAERLVGRFRFTVPEPQVHRFVQIGFVDSEASEPVIVEQQLPSPLPTTVTFQFLDRQGLIRSVEVGRAATDQFGYLTGGIVLADDGTLELAVSPPPGAVALLGLGAGMQVARWDAGLVPEADLAPVQVTWRWQDLAWVGADGEQTPLELPADWDLHLTDQDELAPLPQRVEGEPAVTVTLQPAKHYPGTLTFQLTAPLPKRTLIPMLVTPDLLAATGRKVGEAFRISDGAGGITSARVAGVVEAIPGSPDGSGAIVDLTWMSIRQFGDQRPTPQVTEWWLRAPAGSAAAITNLPWIGEVYDRRTETDRMLTDPLGMGVQVALWCTAAAAALFAGFGLLVDSRATAVRRRRELAVLHTLGTPPAGLTRSLLTEQAVLAGLGVVVGLLVGWVVAAAMGTSLVLTPTGEVPLPAPRLVAAPAQLIAPTLGLFLVTVGLGALVARRARREVAAGALRIGED